jgi:hypothetical protein
MLVHRHDITEILLKVALSTINQSTTQYMLSLAAASRVHLFCNLQSRARTHAVLVIDLYELLGNPTTELIEILLKVALNTTNRIESNQPIRSGEVELALRTKPSYHMRSSKCLRMWVKYHPNRL